MLKEEKQEIVPNIKTPAELKKYLKELYIIDNYMEDIDTYEEFINSVYTIVKGCFERKPCRTYPVRFKFYTKDVETHTLELRLFLLNIFCWLPFVTTHDIENHLNEEFILSNAEDFIEIEDFINNKVITVLQDYNIKETLINRYVDRVLYYLSTINLNFSLIMNLQFDYFEFKRIYDKYPNLRKIMECKFDENLQPHEQEAVLNKYQEEFMTTLKNDPESPIGIMLKCHTGIKEKQLTEFTIAQSYKPTIDGKVITIPIENSTLIRGLDRPSYLFIDANGARKSVVMNKTVMGKAGHFGKIVFELVGTLGLSITTSDCNTKHLLKFKVKNKKYLQKINYRFYKLSRDYDEPLKMINSRKDNDLIGKTIYMRSPVTCALGDCVCARCFGRTASINFDIAKGLPAFESEEITKVVEQNVLSTNVLCPVIVI